MRSTDPKPEASAPRGDVVRRLLPGPTAYGWDRIEEALFRTSLIAFAVAFVLLIVNGAARWDLPLVPAIPAIVGGLLLAWVRISQLMIGPALEGRELHAGYTTLPYRHENVDRLDPKTGRVVRSAGTSTSPPNTGEARPLVSGSRFANDRSPRWPLLVGFLVIILTLVVFVVAIASGSPGFQKSRAAGALSVGVPVLAVGAIALAGVLVGVWLWSRQVKQRVEQGSPGAFRTEFDGHPDVEAVLSRFGASRHVGSAFILSTTDEGMLFWNSPKAPLAVIPWSAVRSVERDSRTVGSENLVVEVRVARDGIEYRLPIGMGWNANRANALLDELSSRASQAGSEFRRAT